MQISSQFNRLNEFNSVILGLTLMGLLGWLDYATGYEVSFAVFYLIPVSMIAWKAGRAPGLLSAVVSALTWHLANSWAGEAFSSPLISVWNTLTRLTFFLVVVVLLVRIRHSLEQEKLLSRRDPLTNALNVRAFRERLEVELEWAHRYKRPFTLAYIDLDNFKTVNDKSGHSTGDQLLCVVAKTLQSNVRATDFVARIGGDEFAVLLHETDSLAARKAVEKFQAKLLKAMRDHNWPTTFSTGVLTCREAPPSLDIDAMIQEADRLMYQVKNSGKNGILSAEFAAGTELEPSLDGAPTRLNAKQM